MEIKLCFSTLPCGNLSVDEMIELCHKYDISGIELRLEHKNRFMGTNKLEEISAIGKQFDEAGIKVTNLGSSVCLTEYDAGDVDDCKHCLDMAQAVGADGVRVFLDNFCRRFDDPCAPIDYDGIVRALRELCDYSVKEIWIETHNEFATGNGLKKLLDDVDRKNINIIWDLMHPYEDGESIEYTFELLKGRISHVHVKDGKKNPDPEYHDFIYTALGEGEIPCKEAAQILKENDYKGFFSLEWENMWRKELADFPDDMDWILGSYIDYMNKIEGEIVK